MAKAKKKKIDFKKIRREAIKPPSGKTVHKSNREFWVLCKKQKAKPSEKVLTSYYWIGSNCKNCKTVAGRL